jgi:hypothetical protein
MMSKKKQDMMNGEYTFTRVNKTVLVLKNCMSGVAFKVGCVEDNMKDTVHPSESIPAGDNAVLALRDVGAANLE